MRVRKLLSIAKLAVSCSTVSYATTEDMEAVTDFAPGKMVIAQNVGSISGYMEQL